MSSLEPGDDESLDRLSQCLWILQRRKGQRASSDDLLLAWAALEALPQAKHLLDLGTGKGTVALLLLSQLPQAQAIGIEAFPESQALALRNAALNALQDRFDPRLGDLRDPQLLSAETSFELITGAPPFMPLGSGIMPQDPQRAAGRFELRGGVEEYAEAAARCLAPGGRLILLMDGLKRSLERCLKALEIQGLALHRRWDIHPRPDTPPTYRIFVAAWEPVVPEAQSLEMRWGAEWSPAYQKIRARLEL